MFLGIVSVAFALNVRELAGPEILSSADTAELAVNKCHNVIQPVSFVQKLKHPWTGNYEHNTLCQEVAVLKNSADAVMCGQLHSMVVFATVFAIFFAGLCVVCCGRGGLCFLLVPFAVAWYYMVATGLWEDYISGAMSWSANAVEGVKPHNVSVSCLDLVSFTYIMTIIIAFYFILFCLVLVFASSMFMMSRMSAETAMTQPLLQTEDREYVKSKEFEVKCRKAFIEADANHDGTLDLKELEHVILFDLSDVEIAYVKNTSLWKEAFDKCDADGSMSIDQREFMEVMKFVYTKAKYGVSKETEAVDNKETEAVDKSEP